MDDDPKRVELPPIFSWLSTRIPEYPDTLSLKMYAHIQELNRRPHFELEPSEHPLSQEYNKGINPERVKKIGSARQSGQTRILRGFPESDEFGLGGCQALCLQQQIVHVSITAAAA